MCVIGCKVITPNKLWNKLNWNFFKTREVCHQDNKKNLDILAFWHLFPVTVTELKNEHVWFSAGCVLVLRDSFGLCLLSCFPLQTRCRVQQQTRVCVHPEDASWSERRQHRLQPTAGTFVRLLLFRPWEWFRNTDLLKTFQSAEALIQQLF